MDLLKHHLNGLGLAGTRGPREHTRSDIRKFPGISMLIWAVAAQFTKAYDIVSSDNCYERFC